MSYNKNNARIQCHTKQNNTRIQCHIKQKQYQNTMSYKTKTVPEYNVL